ncbi:MAG: transcription termination factor NusA [Puniceicoccales bacterium]|jgi:N utilization substance protein A|nr:transcription termination factor NusA [Puniceicoccales bacterium]
MNTGSEIIAVLEYMEKEKGIARNDMIKTIQEAIRSAAIKSVQFGRDVRVCIHPKTGNLQAWAIYEVVDSVADPSAQMHLLKAQELDPKAQLGGIIEKEISPTLLGRIAAQSARQAISQSVRYFEKGRIHEDFKNQVGKFITGTVRSEDRRNLFIDLGKAEGIMPFHERTPGEDYRPGDSIRCLLLRIESSANGPEIILSRACNQFISKLLELEVSEIADGTIVIRGLAREAGYRTKVAIESKELNVDPVGACIGTRGIRIRSICKELGNEKIDILHYYADPVKFLAEAIRPAVPRNIQIDEQDHRIYFEVSEEDLAIAIGKRGLNAKLTSKLMNWKLSINKEVSQKDIRFSQRIQKATQGLNDIPGISDEMAQKLVTVGITGLDVFEGVTVEDLQSSGFTAEEADTIISSVRQFKSQATA